MTFSFMTWIIVCRLQKIHKSGTMIYILRLKVHSTNRVVKVCDNCKSNSCDSNGLIPILRNFTSISLWFPHNTVVHSCLLCYPPLRETLMRVVVFLSEFQLERKICLPSDLLIHNYHVMIVLWVHFQDVKQRNITNQLIPHFCMQSTSAYLSN